MTVNVTTLLVLTTLFISVSDALPRTSYVKMMDIWLIFNLMIPFLEIILQTMIHKLQDEYEYGNEVALFQGPISNNEGAGTKSVNGLARMKNTTDISRQKRDRLLNILELFGLVVLPGLYFIFCIMFFIIGNVAFELSQATESPGSLFGAK